MKNVYFLFFLLATTVLSAQPDVEYSCHAHHSLLDLHPLTPAQQAEHRAALERSDSIDVLNYEINLFVTDFGDKIIRGNCKVDFSPKMPNLDYLALDLAALSVDSVLTEDGTQLDFFHNETLLYIHMPEIMTQGDDYAVRVYYGGTPITCPSGFGGFYFEDGYAYNLGIGLQGNPHNFGRAWFPCFDNFVERSTYDYNITTQGGHRAVASGDFLSVEENSDGTRTWHYRMNDPLPTYLSAIGVHNYAKVAYTHEGEFGPIPVELYAAPDDTSAVKASLENLGGAIDAMEYWYGPYAWNKVGYHMTIRGAMEHSQAIAYPVNFALSDNDNTRLMAHELAHHWWGNIVTPMTQADMWVKEGAAEYSAHQTTEFIAGQEAFIRQVRNNHLDVLTNLHRDDGAYLALSPLSWENTYSRHTYYKGAAMFHNLRGYLGDDLYRSAMTEFQQVSKYEAVDDQRHREVLEQITGMDLGHFYDAWITAPGYSDFEIDSWQFEGNAGIGFNVSLEVQQKLYRAPALHVDVPLQVTVRTVEGNLFTETFVVNGETAQIDFTVPEEPSFVMLNHEQLLNLGRMQDYHVIESTDNVPFIGAGMTIDVEEVGEPSALHIVHHFTAPDPMQDNPNDWELSTTHYFTVAGDFKPGLNLTGRIGYDGSEDNMQLDTALVQFSEDSLLLLYRPDGLSEWTEYGDYNQLKIIPNDGQGFVFINNLQPGDYCYAKGASLVATKSPVELAELSVFPNPVVDFVQLSGRVPGGETLHLKLFDLNGRSRLQRKLTSAFSEQIDLRSFSSGTYLIHLSDEQGRVVRTETVVVP